MSNDKCRKSEIIYNIFLSIIIVALIVLVVLNNFWYDSYKVRLHIDENMVTTSENYNVTSIEDIEDYKGLDTIFSIDIDKLTNNTSDIEIIAFVKSDTNDKKETFVPVSIEDMNIKFEEETGTPIKFSLPYDSGNYYEYRIGVLEDNHLIYYKNGEHKPSDKSLRDKLTEEYRFYIVETQDSFNKGKELYGADILENEINLEEYEEVIKADPNDISTWPQFIIDRINKSEDEIVN